MGMFDRLCALGERQRLEEEAQAHQDQVVSDYGPNAALKILTDEDPDRYRNTVVSDLDRHW